MPGLLFNYVIHPGFRTFYVCCVLLSIAGLYASGWFWSQAAGFVASLGVLGMDVILITVFSILTICAWFNYGTVKIYIYKFIY